MEGGCRPAGVEGRLHAGGGVQRYPRPRRRLPTPLGSPPTAAAHATTAASTSNMVAPGDVGGMGGPGAGRTGRRRGPLVLARAVSGRRAVEMGGRGRRPGGSDAPGWSLGRPSQVRGRKHPTHTSTSQLPSLYQHCSYFFSSYNPDSVYRISCCVDNVYLNSFV